MLFFLSFFIPFLRFLIIWNLCVLILICWLLFSKVLRRQSDFNVYICYTIHILGFPGGASGKEPTCQCRRHKRRRFDPWVRKIPWKRAQQPTPVFYQENPMDREAWWVTVYRVTKSQIWLKRLSSHISLNSQNSPMGRILLLFLQIWVLKNRNAR